MLHFFAPPDTVQLSDLSVACLLPAIPSIDLPTR